MIKKISVFALIAVLTGALGVPTAQAQKKKDAKSSTKTEVSKDGKTRTTTKTTTKRKAKKKASSSKSKKKKSASRSRDAEPVDQNELSEMLVKAMGLSRFLPATPDIQDYFNLLSVNGVEPVDGWKAGETVTKPNLARVIVQAMGAVDEVDDPDKANSYVKYLKSIGVSIDGVTDAVAEVNASASPVADSVFYDATTSDPLDKTHHEERPDSGQFGTDPSIDFIPAPAATTVADTQEVPPAPTFTSSGSPRNVTRRTVAPAVVSRGETRQVIRRIVTPPPPPPTTADGGS